MTGAAALAWRHPPRLERGLGLAAVALGALVLMGWMLDIAALKLAWPGQVTVKANTAIALGACGLATALGAGRAAHRRWPLIAALAVVAALIGALSLAEELLALNLGIDELLFPDPAVPERIVRPGRMSPTAAFCCIAVGVALALSVLPARLRLWLPLAAALGASVTVIGAVTLATHFADRVLGLRWGGAATMAVATAAAFLMLGVAALLRARRLQSTRWALGRAGVAGFALGMLLMLGAAELAAGFALDMRRTAARVVQVQQTLNQLQQVRTELRTLEGAQTAFLLTGDEALLASRATLKASILDRLAALRSARAAEEAPPVATVAALQAAVERRLGHGDGLIVLRRAQGLEAARAAFASGEALGLSREITNLIGPLMQREGERLAGHQRHLREATAGTFLLLPVGSLLGLTAFMSGVFFLDKGLANRRAAEQAQRASQERLERVVENLSSGLLIHGLAPAKVHWNRAALEMFELAPEEAAAMTRHDYRALFELSTLDGRTLPFDAWPMSRLVDGALEQRSELRVRRLDRDWERVFAYEGALVHDDSGSPLVFLTVTDVTARKTAELQLQQLNAELEQRVAQRTDELQAKTRELEGFCYSVSHDLKAPLRGIDGYSRLLFDEYADQLDAEARRFIADVRTATAQMHELIDDLLAYSQQERRAWAPTRIALRAFVDGLIARRTAELTGVELQVAVDDVGVDADREGLEMALRNLIDNALKFSARSQPPTLKIRSRLHDDRVVLTVQDNGTGFDMRYHDKMFEIFQRLHRAEDYPGTGIGLALVRKAMERMGGRVWADSRLGEGSTFHLELGPVC